jgi:hypothetical protein
MIIDIRYHDKAPEQIQKVRLTTVYTGPDADVAPELVLHFYRMQPQRNIPLHDIIAFTVTND